MCVFYACCHVDELACDASYAILLLFILSIPENEVVENVLFCSLDSKMNKHIFHMYSNLFCHFEVENINDTNIPFINY
jgi:hypothetical protein